MKWSRLPGEEWKEIPGTKGKNGWYAVTNKGRVIRVWNDGAPVSVLANARYKNRGPCVCLMLTDYRNGKAFRKSKTFGVKQLVAAAFLPKPGPGQVLAFGPAGEHDLSASNLKWINRSDVPRRRDTPTAHKRKLSAGDVAAIRSRLAAGESVRAVHKDFPFVSLPTIGKCTRR